MQTTTIEPTACPSCGHKIDAATSAYGDYEPAEGDISLCIRCANVSIFGNDLTLRRPSMLEFNRLLDDQETCEMILKAKAAIKRATASKA